MLLPKALKPLDARTPKSYSLYNPIAAQLLRGVSGGIPLEYLEALELVSA